MEKIKIENLYKVFGKNTKRVFPLMDENYDKEEILKKTGCTIGVNNVSFEVEDGEFFVVMGLSGSGKSTLIRCLNRLIKPTKGSVYIDGKDIATCDEESLIEIRRKKMSMVFQNFALFPHRTILSNVEYGLEVQGIDEETRKEKSLEALNLVGLKDYASSKPDELSGGMQQRVGLARALATDPDILLMDEAFSALDPLIRKDMQDELLELQAKMKKTIVFITHDLNEALKLGDRIAIMKDGVIEQIGTPEEILTNPNSKYVKDFVEDVDRTKVLTASSIMQKPNALLDYKDGPNVAVRFMSKEGIASLYVVDKNRILKGIVKIEDATTLVKKQSKQINEIIDKDVPIVDKDTPMEDLLPMAKVAKYPLAVVNENNKLLGIIKRSTIIGGILGEEE